MKERFQSYIGLVSILLLAQQCFAASTIQFSSRVLTVAEDVGQAELTVVRANDPETQVAAEFYCIQATATAGQDYTAVSGAVTFLPGETNQTIVVPILNDGHIEPLERFQVALTNVTGDAVLGTMRVATISIQDNDTPVEFTATAYSVGEADGVIEVSVVRGDDGDLPVTVDYATADGTALAGEDYEAINGSLTFETGKTTRLVTVPILNDTLMEGTKTFSVQLSNLQGASALGAKTNATVSIVDNETPVQLEFTTYWAREDEGFVQIGIVRGGEADPLTLEVATVDGTAKAGEDYQAVTEQITLGAGENLKLLTVPILNDGIKEAEETFRVYLTNAPAGMLGTPNTATIWINDNDPGITFRQKRLWVNENDEAVWFTVMRGNDQILQAFTVDYSTSDGTAKAGIDYVESQVTLHFDAGEMLKSFVVPILDDGVPEIDKQFVVTLSDPSSGMALAPASDSVATATICDVTEMQPHRFEALRVLEEGVVSLTLKGGFEPGVGQVNRFRDCYDVFPIEVSVDMVEWFPLTWVIKTNVVLDDVAFVDSRSEAGLQRFYRTPERPFVVPHRPPSGPFAVGLTSRLVRDEARRNRYRISTNGDIPLQIWYPADRATGKPPELKDWEKRESGTDFAYCVAFDSWGDFANRAPQWRSYAQLDVPFAGNLHQCPVVFWSHGHLSYRYDGQEWAEHLASEGYVVVAIDHFDSGAISFPDGAWLILEGTTGREMNAQLQSSRLRDLSLVLDTMEEWNVEDDLFAGRLSTQRVAAMGFSLGGATAGEFCRTDTRCIAAVAFDPGGFETAPGLTQAGLLKPSLTMHQTSVADSTLFAKAQKDAYWFQITGTEHLSFASSYYSLSSGTLEGRREVARTLCDFTLWFLNRYLRDNTDQMPTLADYPHIVNFKQK